MLKHAAKTSLLLVTALLAASSAFGDWLYMVSSDVRVPAYVTVVDLAASPPSVLTDRAVLNGPGGSSQSRTDRVEPIGVFKPANPAWQFAMSRDGSHLYAVNSFKRSLSIFDTMSFTEVGVMRDLGDTPALIVVPPL